MVLQGQGLSVLFMIKLEHKGASQCVNIMQDSQPTLPVTCQNMFQWKEKKKG